MARYQGRGNSSMRKQVVSQAYKTSNRLFKPSKRTNPIKFCFCSFIIIFSHWFVLENTTWRSHNPGTRRSYHKNSEGLKWLPALLPAWHFLCSYNLKTAVSSGTTNPSWRPLYLLDPAAHNVHQIWMLIWNLLLFPILLPPKLPPPSSHPVFMLAFTGKGRGGAVRKKKWYKHFRSSKWQSELSKIFRISGISGWETCFQKRPLWDRNWRSTLLFVSL